MTAIFVAKLTHFPPPFTTLLSTFTLGTLAFGKKEFVGAR
ncbi:hypothetical protein GPLA_1211 [Paraglaciecola polaris LMG 21857]|uniref:Uncharacterized protein n=1 Tax=Paraglaciecola polaris LMG 21857 TaxID=1129793 RepID=K6Z7E7_9ALTE|nr:hypothetical protein GPLA_1211 [Paraglaciecola polaris LMG 21857]